MTTFLLKVIAMITMTVDHVGYVMRFRIDTDYFRAVGRIAFPIYAFLIVEGCVKTKSIKKYLIRLGLFALISEIPFDLFSQNVPYFSAFGAPVFFNLHDQNIFFTLFFGALCIYWVMLNHDAYKSTYTEDNPVTPLKILLNPRLYAFAGLLSAMFVFVYYLKVDYGLAGVLLILSLYLSRFKKSLQITVLALFMCYIYLVKGGTDSFFTKMFIGSLFTIPLIAGYNGKPGPRPVWLKWVLYAYYPIHLVVLALINFKLP